MYNFMRTFLFKVFILLLVIGCASVKGDFEQASRTDTKQAYQTFLSNHPRSEFDAKAKQRLAELRDIEIKAKAVRAEEGWRQAQNLNTLEAFVLFLKENPNSQYDREAKDSVRSLIRQTTMKACSNNIGLVREGTAFPIDALSETDILKSIARFDETFFHAYGVSNKQNTNVVGSKKTYSYEQMLQLINQVKGYPKASLVFNIETTFPSGLTVQSSQDPTLWATLYRDPDV